MQLGLAGKTAIVTGGSRGIGFAIAKALAKEGVSVVICARNTQKLADATKAIEQEGGQGFAMSLDLANASTIQNNIDGIAQKLGGIDILVNSGARVSGPTPEDFWHVSEDLMQEDFTVKVLGYLRVSRAVAPYMQQNRWGRIIHLSGLAARFAGNISAGFRNAAVVHLSKSMAHALGPNGITTNALLPALVATESLNERLAAQAGYMGLSPEALLASNIQQTPIRRLVTADDIANVALFLASPLSIAINGEAIAVGGGIGQEVHY